MTVYMDDDLYRTAGEAIRHLVVLFLVSNIYFIGPPFYSFLLFWAWLSVDLGWLVGLVLAFCACMCLSWF